MDNDEGWIPHDGGEMPCDEDLLIDVKFRDNDVEKKTSAYAFRWTHWGSDADVVFWRPHKNADGQAGQNSCAAPSQEGHAAGPKQRNKWEIAVDEALIVNHLGTTDSFEDAKEALNRLIQWEIQIATDPAVNGGYVLVKQDDGPACSAPDEALIEEIANDPLFNDSVSWAIREYLRRAALKEKR